MSSRKGLSENSASSSRSNRNTSKDEGGAEVSADDKLFEPSLEMMVNDFDDESTLEMEEKMASTEAEDPNAELNSLQRVSNLRIFFNLLKFHLMMKFSVLWQMIKKELLCFTGRRHAN